MTLIFNFHYVDPQPRIAARKHISISPEGLRQVISTLRKLGMDIISMRDALDQPDRTDGSGKKSVILTFDDGYENFYAHAYPVLEAEKCPATVFVLPGKFGGCNDWDFPDLPDSKRDRLMTLEQMQDLVQSPYITFGSHGLYHRHFPKLDDADLHQEIHESYALMVQHLENAFLPVLAYPWGEYSERVCAVMAGSPYRYAFTTEKGIWQQTMSPYTIPRYTIYWRDGVRWIFWAKLLRNRLL